MLMGNIRLSNFISKFNFSRRIRELESELRIAKEVSVRLHTELEALEDRRYKMEDENFYMKERVRELEAREKRGGGGVQQQSGSDKRDNTTGDARAAAARQAANNLDVSTLMRYEFDLKNNQFVSTFFKDSLAGNVASFHMPPLSICPIPTSSGASICPRGI
jgi:predicted  nucleic acid-binding Zn-ribbon protein